ncbi:FAD-binding oxidoreductase [Halomonas sp. M5N1S17]|uniref:FAD-binding oxidoreductase n=1 Tax=Halomonas alkalisoli TaxID=2907158 RepID=UPI001F3BE966|nr:FAD-binding oxidoreductase [Halomonas alkalisoli]MCE9662221.1 FAD-binding oxidoreductase [Halomonas alkalisoli]
MSTDTARDTFQAALRGALLQAGDPDYESARRLYNGMIDKRPRLIARCGNVADVIRAVHFAREQGLPLAVRGGGHNGAGLGGCDDGLVIDLSALRGIRIDPAMRTARVEGGCTWGDVDHATHAFGLATVSGIISTTGVGGLTLGGGHGHLSRRYGLTIDNLLEADLVLADGRFVTVSETQHPALFWAIRGGGGNFGVATSFLFQLHPVNIVNAGPTLWELEHSAAVLRWYRDFIAAAPESLNGFFALLSVPPAPPFPEHLHNKRMCGIVWCHTGPEEEAERLLAAVHEPAAPALHGVQPMPYPMLQSAFDGLYQPGLQWYWRGDFVTELSDAAIERHVEYAEVPTPLSTMHLYPVDGAVHRVGRHDTAFSHREARWSQVIVGVDPDPANRDRITRWTKDYWDALHPYSAGGGYVNFIMNDEGEERVRATYRDNYARLARIKAEYDPGNLFRGNHNIPPAG